MYHFTLVGFCFTNASIFFLKLNYTQTLQDTCKNSEKGRMKSDALWPVCFKTIFVKSPEWKSFANDQKLQCFLIHFISTII